MADDDKHDEKKKKKKGLAEMKEILRRRWRYYLLRFSFGIPSLFVIAVAVTLEILGIQSLTSANEAMADSYMRQILQGIASDIDTTERAISDMSLRTCREFQENFLSAPIAVPDMSGRVILHGVHQLMDFPKTHSSTVFSDIGQMITVARTADPNVFLVEAQLDPKANGRRYTVTEATATDPPPAGATVITAIDVTAHTWFQAMQGVTGDCNITALPVSRTEYDSDGPVMILGVRLAPMSTIVTMRTKYLHDIIQPRVIGSFSYIADGVSDSSNALVTSSNDDVMDAQNQPRIIKNVGGTVIRGASIVISKEFSKKANPPKMTIWSVRSLFDNKYRVMGIYPSTTVPMYIVVAFNTEELQKFATEATKSFLSITLPVSISCAAISVIIGVVSYIPVTRVKSTLEAHGRVVVEWYKDLNRNNTERLQHENVVKFSNQAAHGGGGLAH
jgi:hypothetical protein